MQHREDTDKVSQQYGTVNVQTCPTSADRDFVLDTNAPSICTDNDMGCCIKDLLKAITRVPTHSLEKNPGLPGPREKFSRTFS